jgi:catechol 2,3-dioxygenase-like lactoylglutathione lyase family enzyme
MRVQRRGSSPAYPRWVCNGARRRLSLHEKVARSTNCQCIICSSRSSTNTLRSRTFRAANHCSRALIRLERQCLDELLIGTMPGLRFEKGAKAAGFLNSPFHFGSVPSPLRYLGNCTALCSTTDMTIKRLDHVSVVVDDLAAAIAFFTTLGMTLEGEMPVEGPWVDRVNGLQSVQIDIVMMRTPDGHGRLELTKFRNPKPVEIEPAIAPPNTLGLRSVMFTVESVDDTVARLRANGAELVGEVAQYEDKYRLCYMRGPAGIIVALAEELF